MDWETNVEEENVEGGSSENGATERTAIAKLTSRRPAPPRPCRYPKRVALVVFAVASCLSLLAMRVQAHKNELAINERFLAMSQRVTDDVAHRLRTYEYGLRGARGAVLSRGSDGIDHKHFLAYSQSRNIDEEFPGARGIGVIWRVPRGTEDTFVAAARRRDQPNFTLHELASHDHERFIIAYIEPVDRNREAVGLDVASETRRRAAALAALRSGDATITAPITLVQATGKPLHAFLLMLPIYGTGKKPATERERETAGVGWSYAPLVMDEVLADFNVGESFALSLRDQESTGEPPFFASANQPDAAVSRFVRQIPIVIYGRTWLADVSPTPQFIEDLNLLPPRTVGATGLGLSVLLAWLSFLWAQSCTRQAEIQAEHARRSAIVDHTSDAVIGESLDGIITSWNRGAEQLFGFRAEDVVGRSEVSFLLPDGMAAEYGTLCAALARGEAVPAFDSTRRRSDGTVIDVSISAAVVVDQHGRRSLSKIIRDISQAKRAEQLANVLNANLEAQVQERTQALDGALRDLHNILDAVPSLVSYWDADRCNRFANHAYAEWFGVDPAEMPGKSIAEVFGDISTLHQQRIDTALGGRALVFEQDIESADGRVRHVVMHYLPDVVDDEVRGFYLVAFDVTAQTLAQSCLAAALRDNEALLGAMNMHAIVSVTDRAGRIVDVNEEFCRLSGYRRDELLGQNHRIVNSGTHDAAFWKAMWGDISAGRPWRGEVCNRRKDGSLYWVDSLIVPFQSDAGRAERYISIRFDITSAKLTEQRLRASQAFLNRAGRVAGVGAWQVDLTAGTQTWSAEMYRIHGVPETVPPRGTDALLLYAPESRASLECAIHAAIEEGVGWDLELSLQAHDGVARWVRSVGEVERDDGATVQLVGSLQDITERKLIELSLAEERHLLTSLLDSLPDSIHFKDKEGRFLRINPGLATRFGLDDPGAAIGRTEEDFLDNDNAQTRAAEQRILASGEPLVDVEEKHVWPGQSPTWSLTTRMAFRNGAGEVAGTFGISRDITARREMEAALALSHERIALAADAANIGIWEYDITEAVLRWDDWMYMLYGHLPESTRKTPYSLWAGALHPDDRERTEALLEAAIAGTAEFDLEFRIVWPTGEVRHLKASAQVIRDAGGRALRMTGVNFDITERKRADLELLTTSTLLQAVLESASEVSLIATDANLTIKVFNHGAERMLGYDADEVIGQTTLLLLHDPDEVATRARELTALSGETVEGGAVFTHPLDMRQARDWTYVRKDWSRLSVSLVMTAMYDDDGAISGYLGIAHDTKLQKQHEERLRKATRKAERANETKSQFLANMSHEIRSPMNAVIGLTYLLGQTALSSEQASFLSKIQKASKSLLALINDVLDVSKIEAGELTVEKAPFNLHHALSDLREVVGLLANAKGVRFELDEGIGIPSDVVGDVTRLNQILNNLVSNAIKFTAAGVVTLRVRAEPLRDDAVTLRFEVEDTGIGIPEDVQARLFVPFMQADASTTRRFGGTGLGLSIVKHLTEMMGGDVGLTSVPGVGSRFWVTLPLELAEETVSPAHVSARPTTGASLAGVRVLLVDDSEINLFVATRILEDEGARVFLAEDGQQAVDRVAAMPNAFDIVLMDVQMPVLDGRQAASKIRNELGLTELPIVALTAEARACERQEALDAGMNDFLTKPFDVSQLIRCILSWVDATTDRGSCPAPAASFRAPALPPRFTDDAAAWPQVTGIDAESVKARLSGDSALFRVLLRRLFDEFPEAPALAGTRPSELNELAGRLHKLKGGAGQLGATDVHHLASEAEEMAREGDERALPALLERLSQALSSLQRDAAACLALPARAPESAAGSTVLSANDLGRLVALLQAQDLAVLEEWQALQKGVQQLVDDATFVLLREQVEGLRFAEAVATLQAHVEVAPEAISA